MRLKVFRANADIVDVTPRVYTPIKILSLMAIIAPSAYGEGVTMPLSSGYSVVCQGAFAKLDFAGTNSVAVKPKEIPVPTAAELEPSVRPLQVMPANLSAAQQAAYKEMEQLEKVSVGDIFPKFLDRGDGPRVAVDHGKLIQYQQAFDDLWRKRIQAGVIPKFEFKRYQKWLRRKDLKDFRPYPELQSADLYTKYLKTNRPLSEYFDNRFLTYVEEEYGINSYETFREWADHADKSMVRFYLRASSKNMGRFFRKMWVTALGAATTAIPLYLYAYPTEIINKLLAPAKDTVAKTITDTGTSLKDYTTGVFNRADMRKSLDVLILQNQQLQNIAFDKLTREPQFQGFESARIGFDGVLPKFKTQIAASMPTFEKDWGDRVRGSQDSTVQMYLEYMRLKDQRDSFDAEIKRSGHIASGEDLSRLNELARRISNLEDFMAGALADFIFYRSSLGADNIPADVKRHYQPILDEFMHSLSIKKVADSLSKIVTDHATNLDKAIPKLTAADESAMADLLAKQKAELDRKADVEKSSRKKAEEDKSQKLNSDIEKQSEQKRAAKANTAASQTPAGAAPVTAPAAPPKP